MEEEGPREAVLPWGSHDQHGDPGDQVVEGVRAPVAEEVDGLVDWGPFQAGADA